MTPAGAGTGPEVPSTLTDVSLLKQSPPPPEDVARIERLAAELADAGLRIDLDPNVIVEQTRRGMFVNRPRGTTLPCCFQHSPLAAVVHQQLPFLFRLADEIRDHPLDDPNLLDRLSRWMQAHVEGFSVESDIETRLFTVQPGGVQIPWGLDDMDDPAGCFEGLMTHCNGLLRGKGSVPMWYRASDGCNWVLAAPAVHAILHRAQLV